LHEVIQAFDDDKDVKAAEPYQLVERLFNEHCELKPIDNDTDDKGTSGDGSISAGDDKSVEIKVRKKIKNSGGSLQSPYDPDAGCSYKGPGYLTHVTETCNNESTEIITDYEVTSAAETDRGKDKEVIDRLVESGKQPEVLYEDGGYPTGQGLIDAKEKGTQIIAPMSGGSLPEDTIGRDCFSFDKEIGLCTQCPAGHKPLRHGMRTTGKNLPATLHAYFEGNKCRSCKLQPKCVVRKPNNSKNGNFHLEVGAHLVARDENIAAQKGEGWWDAYSIRAGSEATMSELARSHGLKKLRVRRMVRVGLAVGLKITACNVKRWLRASACAERTAGRPHENVQVAIYWLLAILLRILSAFRRIRIPLAKPVV
jgi:hypothetical protein